MHTVFSGRPVIDVFTCSVLSDRFVADVFTRSVFSGRCDTAVTESVFSGAAAFVLVVVLLMCCHKDRNGVRLYTLLYRSLFPD